MKAIFLFLVILFIAQSCDDMRIGKRLNENSIHENLIHFKYFTLINNNSLDIKIEIINNSNVDFFIPISNWFLKEFEDTSFFMSEGYPTNFKGIKLFILPNIKKNISSLNNIDFGPFYETFPRLLFVGKHNTGYLNVNISLKNKQFLLNNNSLIIAIQFSYLTQKSLNQIISKMEIEADENIIKLKEISLSLDDFKSKDMYYLATKIRAPWITENNNTCRLDYQNKSALIQLINSELLNLRRLYNNNFKVDTSKIINELQSKYLKNLILLNRSMYINKFIQQFPIDTIYAN